MGLITRTYGSATANPVATGSTILAAHVNTDLDTVYAAVNGNIEDANVKSGAAIAQTKISFTSPVAWTPGYTGFSVNPTLTYATYVKIGKMVTVWYRQNANGTSDSVNFTITNLPYALAAACTDLSFPVRAINSSAYLTTGPIAVLASGGTTLTLYSTAAGGAWTAANGKGVESFSITYPTD